jgi:DNA-binding response OmpR family regulator
VLLAEDDPGIVEIVQLGLSYERMDVTVALDGVEAIRLHREEHPDLVLLDLGLPRLDGLEVLERLRGHRDTPVIILTARDEVDARVQGLEAGADDYVTKPFQFSELVARIRAVLRRHGRTDEDAIEFAGLRVDPAAHEVTRDGRRVELTARQFEILHVLVAEARRVLSKEQIFERVWGWDHLPDPNVVERHISNLRERVDPPGARPLIHTVRGVGYVLREGGSV